MRFVMQRVLPILFVLVPVGVQAQFYKLHGASISAGATGEFTTPLTSNPTTGTFNIATPTGGVLSQTVSGQQQFTTENVGLLASLQFHPVAWAGVEVNYGFTQFTESYQFNYSSATAAQQLNVPVTFHEMTAAYQFHARHIPLQPFVNVGGGAVDFLPSAQSNQWRGAGLVETGIDLPSGLKHVGIRVQGRALIYRAPNFSNAAISTRAWRSTEEPGVSLVYHF